MFEILIRVLNLRISQGDFSAVLVIYFVNFEKPCPEDVYDFWAPWTECSISCGGEGVQTRKRNCATSFFRYSPEFPLSKPCRDNPGTEVRFRHQIQRIKFLQKNNISD